MKKSNYSEIFDKEILNLKYQVLSMSEVAPISELVQTINSSKTKSKKIG